jgi:predicted nucleotidyltransferase
MSATRGIAVSPEHLAIVRAILSAHLPSDAKIHVFGSRAKGTPRPYSDLDLLIDAGRPLTFTETANLSEDFSESDLPWKVDIIDRHRTGEDFLRMVETDCIAFDWVSP